MATGNDIVTQALRRIGVIAFDEDPAGEEAARALALLQNMADSWALSGVDLGLGTITLAGTVTIPANHTAAVVSGLAVACASDFRRPLPQEIAVEADNSFRTLQAHHLLLTDMQVDSGLQKMPSQYWGRGYVGATE